MTIEELFVLKQSQPESINEHMGTLRKYAKQCESVVEFGVGTGYSTVSFLAAGVKTLDSYDLVRYANIDEIEKVAKAGGVSKFTFHLQSSLEAEFDSTDLLFVDSLHNYEQVRDELGFHAHKAKKFLILHDTIAWAYMDERFTHLPAMPNYSMGHKKGIGLAIEEYMIDHPEWQICEHHYHQSGLTCYRRV